MANLARMRSSRPDRIRKLDWNLRDEFKADGQMLVLLSTPGAAPGLLDRDREGVRKDAADHQLKLSAEHLLR